MKTFHHYLIYFKRVILAKKFDRFLHLGLHLNNPSVQVHPYKWKKIFRLAAGRTQKAFASGVL